MVATNVIVSVLLMGMVKYGNIQRDLKKIPVYYLIAMTVFLISKMFFARFLAF